MGPSLRPLKRHGIARLVLGVRASKSGAKSRWIWTHRHQKLNFYCNFYTQSLAIIFNT